MDYIIGLSLTILLALITLVIVYVTKILPVEYFFAPVLLMLILDGVTTGAFYYVLSDVLGGVTKPFRLGIASSFLLSSFGRAFLPNGSIK